MNFFSKIFRYQPQKEYNFILPNSSNNILVEENENIDIYPTLSVNLDYLKVKYNLSEEEIDEVLKISRDYFENKGYKVYFTNAEFEYQNAKRKVEINEYLIAFKE